MSSKWAEMESWRFLVVLSVVLPNAKLVVIAGLYKSVVTNLECLLTVCTMDTWIAVVVCLFGNLWKLECLTTRCDLTLCLFNCSYYLFAGIKRLHARSFRRVQSSTENKFLCPWNPKCEFSQEYALWQLLVWNTTTVLGRVVFLLWMEEMNKVKLGD